MFFFVVVLSFFFLILASPLRGSISSYRDIDTRIPLVDILFCLLKNHRKAFCYSSGIAFILFTFQIRYSIECSIRFLPV